MLPGGAEMKVAWCPAGAFWMGSPEGEEGRRADEVRHRVVLSEGYWMAKYPVTQRQWVSVMGSNPSWSQEDDSQPAEYLSWAECGEFCRRAGGGMRLPTEAEWEHACLAGRTAGFRYLRRRVKNQSVFEMDRLSCTWYAADGRELEAGDLSGMVAGCGGAGGRPMATGRMAANPWGLCGMLGGVWEWCADRYGAYSAAEVADPRGAAAGALRVCRGGAWTSSEPDCRPCARRAADPGHDRLDIGFRPVIPGKAG